ncbi:MAG: ArsB/NhaD family transporter [Selenomonadaceae bacterium]|nr:ArsB/NhaD family transporter [Selenomonadaceae bacterium]
MEVMAAIIFVIMYAVIVSEKIHRTVAAMIGAVLMMLLGILSQEVAIHHIDFNTLGLLTGMMLLVGVTSHTGLFDFVAIWAAKKAKADPKKILTYLGVLTAVFSAFLDNVTTVLLMVPVTFSITKQLNLNPRPFLLTQILASNIGGTATLIGDPPNIMIGSAVKIPFMAFIENLAPLVIIQMVVVIFLFEFIYEKELHTTPELQKEMMKMDEYAALKDKLLLKKSLFVLSITIIGFFTHQFHHIDSALMALAGGFLLLLLAGGGHDLVEETMKSKVEWATIFFFIGLFIAVGGLIEVGIIGEMARAAVEFTGGDVTATSLLVIWLSAIVSSVLDNIPFVATMIPLIQDMGAMGISNLEPIWWSLALGACLGGNGTLVGASANLIVAGLAAARGVRITFTDYFKVGFPIMLLTVVMATVYVYLRYLM